MKRIGRTIPPAASPISPKDIINGLKGLIRGQAEVERFRSELKSYFNVKHVFLVSSGKAALTLILRALHKLTPNRNEVIIPAFCCYSVPSAIVRADLKVKLCDVDPDTLDYNYSELKKIIAEYQLNKPDNLNNPREASHTQHAKNNTHTDHKLLAVIPLHLFGIAADVEHVRSLVNDPSVNIIEDAAQVMGSEKNGKKLGTFGDVSFFSLGRSKPISAVEGGIILTNNGEIAQQISAQVYNTAHYSNLEQIELILQALALVVFQRPSFFWFPKLMPFLRVGNTIYDPAFKTRRLSGFQAGLVRKWRTKLADFQKQRKECSLQWALTLSPDNPCNYASQDGSNPDFIRYPIRIKDAKIWQETLKVSEKKGLGIMLTYPASINSIDELQEVFKGQNFPAAEKLPHQLVTLPIHPYVTTKDRERISQALSQLKSDKWAER